MTNREAAREDEEAKEEGEEEEEGEKEKRDVDGEGGEVCSGEEGAYELHRGHSEGLER